MEESKRLYATVPLPPEKNSATHWRHIWNSATRLQFNLPYGLHRTLGRMWLYDRIFISSFFFSPTKYRTDELNTAVDISIHPTSKLYDLNSKFTSTTLV